MKTSKLFKRFVAGTLLSGIVAFTGLVTLILNPQSLFANKATFDIYSIYANEEIDMENLVPILKKSTSMLEQSELYDPSYQYEIFFSYNSFYNKLDNILFDPNAAARPTDNNLIVKVRTDIKKGICYTDRSEIDLTYVMVHEMIHCLQENKYGKWMFNPYRHPPMWKLEGYPEYVARQDELQRADYSLKNEIKRYLALEKASPDFWIKVSEKHFLPKIYMKGRLMVEYLMDIKKMSYDEILQDHIQGDSVYQEMINWMETK